MAYADPAPSPHSRNLPDLPPDPEDYKIIDALPRGVPQVHVQPASSSSSASSVPSTPSPSQGGPYQDPFYTANVYHARYQPGPSGLPEPSMDTYADPSAAGIAGLPSNAYQDYYSASTYGPQSQDPDRVVYTPYGRPSADGYPAEPEPGPSNQVPHIFNDSATYDRAGAMYDNAGATYDNAGATYDNAGATYDNAGATPGASQPVPLPQDSIHAAGMVADAESDPEDRRGEPAPSKRHSRRSRSSRHSSITAHDLVRLIVNEERATAETKRVLVAAEAQLARETARAESAEKLVTTALDSVRAAHQQRLRAEHERGALDEELRLFRAKLEEAQREIARAQGVLDRVAQEREAAEDDASRTRGKARRLKEEREVARARETGRREGFQEGLHWARKVGVADARVMAYEERRADEEEGPYEEEYEEEEEEEEEEVHGGEPEEYEDDYEEPQQYAPTRGRPSTTYVRHRNQPNFQNQPDFGDGPQSQVDAVMGGAPHMAAVHAEMRSPEPQDLQYKPAQSGGGGWLSKVIGAGRRRPPQPAYTISAPSPMLEARSAPASPRMQHTIPPDNFIPHLDEDGLAWLPPPHQMSPRPPIDELPPPAPPVQLAGDPALRVQDFAYVNRVPAPARSQVGTVVDQRSIVPEVGGHGRRESIARTDGGRSVAWTEGGRSTRLTRAQMQPRVDDEPQEEEEYEEARDRQALADNLRYPEPQVAQQARRSGSATFNRSQGPPRKRPPVITTPQPLAGQSPAPTATSGTRVEPPTHEAPLSDNASRFAHAGGRRSVSGSAALRPSSGARTVVPAQNYPSIESVAGMPLNPPQSRPTGVSHRRSASTMAPPSGHTRTRTQGSASAASNGSMHRSYSASGKVVPPSGTPLSASNVSSHNASAATLTAQAPAATNLRRIASTGSVGSAISRTSSYKHYNPGEYVDPAFLASSNDVTAQNTLANSRTPKATTRPLSHVSGR